MKKNLKLTLLNLLFFWTIGSITGQVTEISDFAKRPQHFQGKIITLKNVKIQIENQDDESPALKRGNKKADPKTTKAKSEKPTLVLFHPPCPSRKGWSNIYPEISDIKMHVCFVIPSRMNDQLPKSSYHADITFVVDVRSVCEIKKIKLLK
jgi:hypothetical protein